MPVRAGLNVDPLIQYATTANPYTGLNPAANIGVGALQPSLADAAVYGAGVTPQTTSQFELPEMSGMSGIDPSALMAEGLRMASPPAQAPEYRVAYSPTLQKFLVNDTLIDYDDLQGLESVPELLQRPATGGAPAGDWRDVSLDWLYQHKEGLKSIGFAEGLKIGSQNVLESVVGGVGRGFEMAGAETVGGALVGAGQAMGPSEYTRDRMAAAWEGQSLWSNIWDGVAQGAPSFAASIAAGYAGGKVGAAVGSIGGAPGAAAGALIGGAIGAAMSIFPMMLYSAYDTAVTHRGDDYVNSPEGRIAVTGTAIGTTLAQTIAPTMVASRIINGLSMKAGEQVARKAYQNAAIGATTIGFTEGLAEASAIVIEQAVFDPTISAILSGEERQALLPYVREQYGEEIAVAFAAGAILGGAVGGVTSARRTGPIENTGDETDLLALPAPPPALPPPPAAPQLALPAPPLTYQPSLDLTGGESPPPGPPSFMPPVAGAQGTLDVGVPGQPMTMGEAALRAGPREQPTPIGEAAPSDQLEFDYGRNLQPGEPQQDLLNLVIEPPTGVGFTDQVPVNAMQLAMQRAQETRMQQQRQAELEAQAEAQRQQAFAQAERDRQLAIAQQAEMQAQAQAIPQPVQPPAQPIPTVPQQLPLFTGREAPRPSRGELLRRGLQQAPDTIPAIQPEVAGPPSPPIQLELPAIARPVTPQDAQNMWEENRPKATRKWENLSPARQQEWVDAIAAGVATPALRSDISRAESAARLKPKEKPSAVQKPVTKKVDVRERPEDGEAVGERDTQERKAAKKGEALKKGKKKVVVKPKPTPAKAVEGAIAEPEKEAAPVVEPKPAPKLVAKPTPKPTPKPAPKPTVEPKKQQAVQAKQVILTTIDRGIFQDRADDDIVIDIEAALGAPLTGKTIDMVYELIKRRKSESAKAEPAVARTDAEVLAQTISDLETTTGVNEYKGLMWDVMDYAYNKDYADSPVSTDARDYLADIDKSDTYKDVLLDYIRGTSINAVDAEGAMTPLYQALSDADLLNKARRVAKLRNEPGVQAAEAAEAVAETTETKDDTTGSPAVELANAIDAMRRRAGKTNTPQKTKDTAQLKRLWKKTQEAGLEDSLYTDGATPLSEFFTEAGAPKFDPVSNKPVTDIVDFDTQLEQAAEESKARKAAEAVERKAIREEQARLRRASVEELERFGVEAAREGVVSTDRTEAIRAAIERVNKKRADAARDESILDQFNQSLDAEGRFYRDDGTPIKGPLPLGKIKAVIAAFKLSIRVKPNIYTFKNQADLKARNRALYDKAVAARPQGDFDSTSAVGYAFDGDKIIIFTDRVATEQQLKFVLAHETLGHFGMRSLLSDAAFNKLMDEVYVNSPSIHTGVEQVMDVHGVPRAEATEEYLADMAASLDVSIIARIWNAIKGVLNKVGIKFGDEYARYIVNQARRYVRNGKISHNFELRAVIGRIVDIESGKDPDGTGRFAHAQAHTFRTANIAAAMLNDVVNALPGDFRDAGEWLQKQAKKLSLDVPLTADAFIAKFFMLTPYRARENEGYSRVYKIVSEGKDIAMSLKVGMNEKMKLILNRAVASLVKDMPAVGGISTQQSNTISKALYDAQLFAISKLDAALDAEKKTRAELIEKRKAARAAKQSTDAIDKQLEALAANSLYSKTPLFSIDANGEPKPNDTEIDRLYQFGKLRFEQMRDGYTYQIEVEENGKTVKRTVTVPGIPGLTTQSIEWRGYEIARESMRDIELKLLEAHYRAFAQDKSYSFKEIASNMDDGKLTPAESKMLSRVYQKYKELWGKDKIVDENGDLTFNPESVKEADDFIAAVNRALIAREAAATDAEAQSRNDAVRKYFDGKVADDIIAQIESFKMRINRADEKAYKFLVQNNLKQILIADISNDGSDMGTKNTLLRGYTPVVRKGDYQTRVVVYDRNGKIVRLKDAYKEQLVYSRMGDASDALSAATLMNESLFNPTGKNDTFYQAMGYNESSGKYELMDVRLEAVAERALDAVAAPPELNLHEFTRGLRRFNITLQPKKLEEVIVALTKQDARARKRLRRAFTPGGNPDAIFALTQHIESRASTVAKVTMRPRLHEAMNLNMKETRSLWYGDKSKLDRLAANVKRVLADPNTTESEREAARKEYDAYAYTYNKTNPKNGVGQGNQYYNEAASLLAFLDGSRNVDESNFGSGEVASAIRALTSMFQLGASFATGMLNYIGMGTNGIPYLATYNAKKAFGGGFGAGKSVVAVLTALNQIGLRRSLTAYEITPKGEKVDMNMALFYDLVAENKGLQEKYGLNVHEAKFIAREIRAGVMIPAQSNALVGYSRGRASSGAVRKTIDGVMWTFNSTEQGSRRGLGLAAYRLAFERAIGNGKSEADAAIEAREFAVNAIERTVGEYSVISRPAAWRDGVQSFMYMYKVFPTTSIELMGNLPWKGKLYMGMALITMSGLMGLPFAEDIEDLLDTLAQMMGISTGSLRYEAAKVFDSIIPGSSPYFLNGVVNQFLPGDLASRTELGNFIPGTGMFLAGANTTREITDILGPAASMLSGVGVTGVNTMQWLFGSGSTTFTDVLRESPVTMLRALGDTMAYNDAGAIVDRRGYVISKDLHAGTMLARIMGFYPTAASQQYQVIRVAQRIVGYQKEVSASFRVAWVKAKISGDNAQAREIERAVDGWNKSNKGTALEIKNFRKNAAKALKEARRPAKERYLRTTPKAARDDIERMADLLGY